MVTIFEIPIYVCSEDAHYAEQDQRLEPARNAARQQGMTVEDAERFWLRMHGRTWRFNQIVGWLDLQAAHDVVKGFLWWADAERLHVLRAAPHTVSERDKVLEIWLDDRWSSDEIYRVISDAQVVSPAEGETTDPDDTVISWEPVADPPGSQITGYQVVVEREGPVRVFSVDLPPSATSVTVPAEFLEPGTDYKVEVLGIEEGGNQTITEVEFQTA